MRLELITGNARTCTCSKCGIAGTGGTRVYRNAHNISRYPTPWYQEKGTTNPAQYCNECAPTLHAHEFLDPTRSVNVFYSTTFGDSITENLLPS